MKRNIYKNAKYLFIGTCLLATTLIVSSWTQKNQEGENDNPIPGMTSNEKSSFATVDAATELLVPGNKIYHRHEALELKKKLEESHSANPNDLAVNMALVRYHACAPNFAGGFRGVANQHAAEIYRQNAYVGCLAYEYIYSINGDYEKAETWYKMSLACKKLDGMEWREFSYQKSVSFGVGLKGTFTNNKIQALYQNSYGTYKRKVMMPNCGGNCEVTLVPGFLRGSNSASTGRLIFTPY